MTFFFFSFQSKMLLSMPEQRRSKADFNRPSYLGAAVSIASRKKGIPKVDKKRLLGVCDVPELELNRVSQPFLSFPFPFHSCFAVHRVISLMIGDLFSIAQAIALFESHLPELLPDKKKEAKKQTAGAFSARSLIPSFPFVLLLLP
jgi:hypothetical protein